MSSPGSLCPTVKASEILGDKWTLLLLRELFFGSTRYAEFQRALPRISPSVLSARLKKMEQDGLVVHQKAAGQQRGDYRLTAAAKELAPIVDSLARWGLRWARDQLCDADLDAGTLMWDLHRALDSATLPDGRHTLCFIVSGADTSQWWLVIEGSSVDLCNEDPGFDVDVYLTASLAVFAGLFLGDLPVEKAVINGEISVTGAAALQRSVSRWFPVSSYAEVRPQSRSA